MFTLHLDLRIHFVPPMSEHASGIVLTRVVEVPFAPVEGTRVFSKAFDECKEPEGFVLKDILWDVDREVLLAHTVLVNHDFPLTYIPAEIRNWIDRGWRYGSYRDDYPSEGADDDDGPDCEDTGATQAGELNEFEIAEGIHRLSWRQRSAGDNRVLRALIRHMVETYDNVSGAYAFDKTGRYFTEYEIRNRDLSDNHVNQFMDCCRQFETMSLDEQEKWRKRTQRYPCLQKLSEDWPCSAG